MASGSLGSTRRTDIQHQPMLADRTTLSVTIMRPHILLSTVSDTPVGAYEDGFGHGTLCAEPKESVIVMYMFLKELI